MATEEADRHRHSDAHPAELTPAEARQASSRPMTFRVLVFGTLLAVLAGLAIGAAFYLPGDRQSVVGAPPGPRR